MQKELNLRQLRWLESFKDYDCIIDYHPGKVFRPNDIYKLMTLLPKDYYLFHGNSAKNLLRPFFHIHKNLNLFFFL